MTIDITRATRVCNTGKAGPTPFLVFAVGFCEVCGGEVQEANGFYTDLDGARTVIAMGGSQHHSATPPAEIYATEDGTECEMCAT